MRITRYYLATLVGLAAMLALGCRDSTGPTTTSVLVTVLTAGTEADPDGYTLSIDDGQGRAVGVNATVTIGGLPTGNHLFRLDGLASNCSVSGTNPRSVNVIAVNAASPISVSFSVSCLSENPWGY